MPPVPEPLLEPELPLELEPLEPELEPELPLDPELPVELEPPLEPELPLEPEPPFFCSAMVPVTVAPMP